jgi:hypothetical protein
VLKMVDVEFIKKKYENEGWPIRKIARQLEVSRQTVRKVLASPPEPPRYQQAVPRSRPVVGPYLPVIERWLKEEENAPRQAAPHRQARLRLLLLPRTSTQQEQLRSERCAGVYGRAEGGCSLSDVTAHRGAHLGDPEPFAGGAVREARRDRGS